MPGNTSRTEQNHVGAFTETLLILGREVDEGHLMVGKEFVISLGGLFLVSFHLKPRLSRLYFFFSTRMYFVSPPLFLNSLSRACFSEQVHADAFT